jgi:hypothetical protein
MGSMSGGDSSQTVQEATKTLAVRDQWAEAQERLVKAEKQYDTTYKKWESCEVSAILGMVGGGVALVVGMILPLTPIAAIVGAALLAGGGATLRIGERIHDGARKKLNAARAKADALKLSAKKAAIEETLVRQKALTDGAEAEFDGVLRKFKVRAGMEIPFALNDNVQKVLRIERVEAKEILRDGGFVPMTTVTAQLYDAHIDTNGNPVRDQPVPKIPPLKRTIVPSEKALPL